ncbi:hypothetical protein OAA91_00705 [Fibrobacterales bacterium]|nr:hypothetical protein [Fibrobacterales bacterium]
MNFRTFEKTQSLFARAISLLLVFSVLSFGYQPTCLSMQTASQNTEKSQKPMLNDHSCCIGTTQDQYSQVNSDTTQIEISKFTCQCKSQILTQTQPNSEIKLISSLKLNYELSELNLRANTIVISSSHKAIPLRTGPPISDPIYNKLKKILI